MRLSWFCRAGSPVIDVRERFPKDVKMVYLDLDDHIVRISVLESFEEILRRPRLGQFFIGATVKDNNYESEP